jgi:hypothetical protein
MFLIMLGDSLITPYAVLGDFNFLDHATRLILCLPASSGTTSYDASQYENFYVDISF